MNYKVAIEGFILGDYKKVGETVTLNERQARDFLREGRLEAAAQVKKPAPKAASPKAAD